MARIRDKLPRFPPLRGFGPQVEHPNLTVQALLPSNKRPNHAVKRKQQVAFPSFSPSLSLWSWLHSIKPKTDPFSPVPFNWSFLWGQLCWRWPFRRSQRAVSHCEVDILKPWAAETCHENRECSPPSHFLWGNLSRQASKLSKSREWIIIMVFAYCIFSAYSTLKE